MFDVWDFQIIYQVCLQLMVVANSSISLIHPPSLVPGERYFYVFGDPTFGLSQEFSFTASPITSPDSTVRVVVYGGR